MSCAHDFSLRMLASTRRRRSYGKSEVSARPWYFSGALYFGGAGAIRSKFRPPGYW